MEEKIKEQPEWKKVIGYAIYDKEFRRKLIENPEKAIQEAGFDIRISAEDLEKFKALKGEFALIRGGPDQPSDCGW